jgi:type II secretory pathway component PulK
LHQDKKNDCGWDTSIRKLVFAKPNNKFKAIGSVVNNENSLQTSSVTGVVKDKEVSY